MGFQYPEKIQFKCLECGICCGDTQEKTRHILLLDEEAQNIAKSVNKSVSDIASKVKDKKPYGYEMKKNTTTGKCVFLKENRCTIYPKRPLICKFYPFGLETSRENQKVFFFTTECPGIGHGKVMQKNDYRILLSQAEEKTTHRRNAELQI